MIRYQDININHKKTKNIIFKLISKSQSFILITLTIIELFIIKFFDGSILTCVTVRRR